MPKPDLSERIAKFTRVFRAKGGMTHKDAPREERDGNLYTYNPQQIGLKAFFACKARNVHLAVHIIAQQKCLTPSPTKRLEVIR